MDLTRTASAHERERTRLLLLEAAQLESEAVQTERDLEAVRAEIEREVQQQQAEPEPAGLQDALRQLAAMGFPEGDAHAALLAMSGRPIGPAELEQAMNYLLTGEMPAWHQPAEPERIDPNDPVATAEAIDRLIGMVTRGEEHRTEEYRTCFRMLLEKGSIRWRCVDGRHCYCRHDCAVQSCSPCKSWA
jgi:hypothetical protein